MANDESIKCACGCGLPAPIAQRSDPKRGYVKGQPTRYIVGHHTKLLEGSNARYRRTSDPWERIKARCVLDGSCLVWQGGRSKAGYGTFSLNGVKRTVHSVAYEYFFGPVPQGMEIDHVKARGCHSRACCNVAHMEAVPQRENSLRGNGATAVNAKKTHCPRGHLLAGNNLVASKFRKHGHRECRLCFNERRRKARTQ